MNNQTSCSIQGYAWTVSYLYLYHIIPRSNPFYWRNLFIFPPKSLFWTHGKSPEQLDLVPARLAPVHISTTTEICKICRNSPGEICYVSRSLRYRECHVKFGICFLLVDHCASYCIISLGIKSPLASTNIE